MLSLAPAVISWVPDMNFPPETVDVFGLGQEGISREVLSFLIVALNTRYVMDSPGFSMNIYDNVWPITTSTARRLMLSDDLRGVSKHNAGAVVISQDRSDLSGDTYLHHPRQHPKPRSRSANPTRGLRQNQPKNLGVPTERPLS